MAILTRFEMGLNTFRPNVYSLKKLNEFLIEHSLLGAFWRLSIC